MARHEIPPDLLLVNGTAITIDANDRIAEAIAIRGYRIVAVGTTVSIDSLAGPETQRIDLAGRTVTPGLLDAHAHFSPDRPVWLNQTMGHYGVVLASGELMVRVFVLGSGGRTIDEARGLIAKWAAMTRPYESTGDDPFGGDEAVNVRTALRAATIWAAHQMFLDTKPGSIEVGKYADLAVRDRNPHQGSRALANR